jgi:hypothetical protein
MRIELGLVFRQPQFKRSDECNRRAQTDTDTKQALRYAHGDPVDVLDLRSNPWADRKPSWPA